MNSLGERLRDERLRLKLPHADFGALAGSGRTTVINWEKGDSSPTAVQLAAFAAAGVDVLFVITGQRQPIRRYSTGSKTHHELSEPAHPSEPTREDLLVQHFQALDEKGRKAVEQMVAALRSAKS